MTEPTTDTSPAAPSTPEATPPPATPDGYTAPEAARLLGVSPRRVRQLLDSGTLTSAWTGERPESAPVILDRESVHKEREARKASRKEPGKPEGSTGAGLTATDLLDVFERMQERTLETLRTERTEVLAIRDRTEEDLRNALAAERAAREMAEREAGRLAGEAEELRAEAARLRAEVEAAEALARETHTVRPGVYWGEVTTGPEPVEETPAPAPKKKRWWQG